MAILQIKKISIMYTKRKKIGKLIIWGLRLRFKKNIVINEKRDGMVLKFGSKYEQIKKVGAVLKIVEKNEINDKIMTIRKRRNILLL